MHQLIGMLFHARTQTHIAHLQTKSYAKHIALNDFYHEIGEKADELAEAYQGRHGIITGYKLPSAKDMTEDAEVIKFFEDLSKYVMLKRGKILQEPCVLNIVDEIQALILSITYKLKNLE